MYEEKYAQIQYDGNDLENVTVKEVRDIPERNIVSEQAVSESLRETAKFVRETVNRESPHAVPNNTGATAQNWPSCGRGEGAVQRAGSPLGGEPLRGEGFFRPESQKEEGFFQVGEPPKEEEFFRREELAPPKPPVPPEGSFPAKAPSGQGQQVSKEASPNMESEHNPSGPVLAEASLPKEDAPSGQDGSSQDARLAQIEESLEGIKFTMRRLEKKFETEILNSETRDHTVKTIYKELNEYKAGLIEKALREVLYDFIDIREMMLSKAKYLQKGGEEGVISVEEFLSYAEDIGDILEKHDVSIYKGEPGLRNVATRQKIVRKVETEEEALVKTVAESLSYGYEYNGKVIYPEKISIYTKKLES